MPDTTEKRGGARAGAGRPKGSANKLPLKSMVARERVAALLEPHLEALVNELLRLALHADKDQDRLRALVEALNRLAGKVPDTIEVNAGSEAPKTVADLLGLRDEEAH